MTFTKKELEYLSVWACEEKANDPYSLPAHQLQADHKVAGVTFIRAIKAWARLEGRKDEEIFQLHENARPSWPWSSEEEMANRLSNLGAEVRV